MLLEPLFLEEAYSAVVDELPPAISSRLLDDETQHIEPPTPAVVVYPITAVDELPPAGAPRELADVPITFTPIVIRPYATVVDGLPPAGAAQLLDDENQHIEPPTPAVVVYPITAVDELPPVRTARELSDVPITFTPIIIRPYATVVDEVPPASAFGLIEWTFTPNVTPSYAAVIDELTPATHARELETPIVTISPAQVAPFTDVVDELAPDIRARALDTPIVTIAPLIILPFAAVVDELVPEARRAELESVPELVEPPSLIVPYFESSYPDIIPSVAFQPYDVICLVEPPSLIVPYFESSYPDIIPSVAFQPYDVVCLVEPPVTPPPPTPPRRRSAGYGPAGGGGGGWDGEVYRFCDEVDEQGRKVRRVDCEEPVTEDLGDSDSAAAGLAGMFGAGAAGFVGSKAVTRAVEKRFGKHAGAAAAVISIVATAKASDKLAEKSPRLKSLGTAVFGSVIAAVDDLVDIYVNERGKKPSVQHVDAATIVARAQETSSLYVTRRLGTKRSTRQRVLVLRYVSLQENPAPTMYVYQEVVVQNAGGQFSLRGTLLELIRRAKRGV